MTKTRVDMQNRGRRFARNCFTKERALVNCRRRSIVLTPAGVAEGRRGVERSVDRHAATPPVAVGMECSTLEGSQIEWETLCDPSRVGLEGVAEPGVSLRVGTVPVQTLRSTPGYHL